LQQKHREVVSQPQEAPGPLDRIRQQELNLRCPVTDFHDAHSGALKVEQVALDLVQHGPGQGCRPGIKIEHMGVHDAMSNIYAFWFIVGFSRSVQGSVARCLVFVA